MAQERSIWGRVDIFSAILRNSLQIIVALALFFGINNMAGPDPRYQILPAYRTAGGAAWGIVLANSGHAVAKNIRLRLTTDEMVIKSIVPVNFVTDPITKSGGIGHTEWGMELDQLSHDRPPGEPPTTVYIETDEPVIPTVRATYDGGSIKPVGIGEDSGLPWYAQALTYVLEFLGLYAIVTWVSDRLLQHLRDQSSAEK
jgi:hypothetical protein